MTLTAFLLCAGYGQRLRPLTERIAKPALTFQGQSALEINQRRIESLRPQRWIANSHHLPDQIEALGKKLGIEVLQEPEILGTGGCLDNAAEVLRQTEHFLVHNADLIHTIDLEHLWEKHLRSGALATLAGIHHPRHNTLSVSTQGLLLGMQGYAGFEAPADSSRLTFAGIAFYRKEFLDCVKPGCEDIKPYWKAALDAGAKIHVEDCSGAAWHDFGSPQGLWEAAKFHMESTGEFGYRYPSKNARPFVSNEAGQENLPDSLRNVLIYETAPAAALAGAENCILGGDFKWDINPA